MSIWVKGSRFAAGHAGIFSEYFFETISGGGYSDGRVYLVFAAGPSFAVFSAAGMHALQKFRKAAVILFLIWTGFSAGLLFSMAVLGMEE